MISKDEVVELNIDSIGFEGKAIARLDGYVIFVAGGVPGDVVKAKVIKRKRDYAEAKVIDILTPSSHRVEPVCRYFGVCGGCRWQHLDYNEQVSSKRRHVIDALERTAGLKLEVKETVGADNIYEYRNKLEFTFSENPFRILENDPVKVALGFHSPGRYDKTIDIAHCHLGDEKTNRILNWFRDKIAPESAFRTESGMTIYNPQTHSGSLRFLTVRKSSSSDEYMVNLFVLNEDAVIERLATTMKQDLPFVSTFTTIVNSTRAQVASGTVWRVHFGNGYITEKIGKYSFKISPLSFFQTNTLQAEKLYETALAAVGGRQKVIYDFYSGTGSISIYLSEFADQVYGFELADSSVKDAEENANLNGVKNVRFVKTDLAELFKGRDPAGNFRNLNLPKPDLIVVDPPRNGLHPKISANIHLLQADKIVYVSCNPMTQARDVKEIVSHGYTPVSSQPVDMFPQTYHIENVLTLVRG
ncbi:MAG: 23S rRNA (uracil(1939)-C(5))-methyltransferase RlmD [Bacteroidetes bacterium]|nr:23S rRNA (uracil(1939)-C(5))-methyltransferase RlmD [Bacteroidota bacterium]